MVILSSSASVCTLQCLLYICSESVYLLHQVRASV